MDIPGLEKCPFCPYAVIIENKDDKVFHCANCKKVCACSACVRACVRLRSCVRALVKVRPALLCLPCGLMLKTRMTRFNCAFINGNPVRDVFKGDKVKRFFLGVRMWVCALG